MCLNSGRVSSGSRRTCERTMLKDNWDNYKRVTQLALFSGSITTMLMAVDYTTYGVVLLITWPINSSLDREIHRPNGRVSELINRWTLNISLHHLQAVNCNGSSDRLQHGNHFRCTLTAGDQCINAAIVRGLKYSDVRLECMECGNTRRYKIVTAMNLSDTLVAMNIVIEYCINYSEHLSDNNVHISQNINIGL